MSVVHIRRFYAGEEQVLRGVFFSSVHGIARSHYTVEQRNVWAPIEYDSETWANRIRRNGPWVAERDGAIAGFADVQPNGYIDQFFVAEYAAGQGIGGALMRHLETHAKALNVSRLTSHVSLSAQPFFRRFGFSLEAAQTVIIQGISLENARMFKVLPTQTLLKPDEPPP
ncbi:GNAT family N-acetyltransferase [Singulisphaera sp. Ch08]|uniref:GNAT family N-acetyltransferase n=1 Tax=Singulisphaera sp. Ch08 TaxID=3120278 RepID=A0AAU7C7I3_9BACT